MEEKRSLEVDQQHSDLPAPERSVKYSEVILPNASGSVFDLLKYATFYVSTSFQLQNFDVN